MTVLLRFTSGIFRSLFHPPLISFLTFVLYIELFCSSPPVSSGLSFTPLTFYLLLKFYNFYQNFLRLAPDNPGHSFIPLYLSAFALLYFLLKFSVLYPWNHLIPFAFSDLIKILKEFCGKKLIEN